MLGREYKNLNNPLSFGGLNTISRYYDGKKKNILQELQHINPYLLHREVKKPRVYNPIYVYNTREIMQADLISLISLGPANNDYKYLYVLCDSFSRKAWVAPMKTTQAQESFSVLKKLHQATGPFKVFYCDRGGEFKNRLYTQFFRTQNIEMRFPSNKCGTVERLNRTLQNIIYRYLTNKMSDRYIDALPKIVALYNKRYHRIIKCSPAFADKAENRKYVLEALAEKYAKVARKHKKPKYKIGQLVLIQKSKGNFAKGYERVFKRERYRIISVHAKLRIPMYSLETQVTREPVIGRFYENELQAIDTDVYQTEILKERINKKTKQPEIFVHFTGYPSSDDRWIPKANLTEDY